MGSNVEDRPVIRREESDRQSNTLLLGPDEHAAAEARHHLHQFLVERDVAPERLEPAELVVSERVTNAEVEVYSRIDGDAVRIWVSDEVPITPHPHEPTVHGGGWGLHIIHEVATRWGVSPRVDGHPGKPVWAEVLLA